LSIKAVNISAIGVNILAWVLIVIGLYTSPLLASASRGFIT
jgi:hypothetical protein